MFETWHINPPVTNWALYLQLLQGSETRWAGTNDTPQSLLDGNLVSNLIRSNESIWFLIVKGFSKKDDKRLLIVNAMWWFENKNGLQPVVLPVVVCHQNAFKKNVKNDSPAYAGHTLSFLLTWNDLPMFASSPCLRTQVEPCCVLRLVTVVHGIERNHSKLSWQLFLTLSKSHIIFESLSVCWCLPRPQNGCVVSLITKQDTWLKKKLSVFPL